MASFRSGHFRLLLAVVGSACFSGWQWSYKQQPLAPKVRSCCIVSTRAATSDTAGGEGSQRLQKLFERALRFSDRGHNDRAIRTYKEIIRNSPQCQEAWLNLGICRASIDPDGALRAFDQALALDPSYHDAHYNKALVLDDLGLVSEALESFHLAEEYATLQKDLSSSAMYCCSSGLLLASEQRYDQALSAYDRAIRLEGPGINAMDARINRGELLCELQRFPEAIQSHNEALAALAALELDSKDSLRCGILYNLAYTYAVQGDKESCEETLNRALTVDRAQVLTILLNFQGEASLLSQRREEEMAFLKQLQDGSKDRGLLVEVVKQLRTLEENPRWILERLLDSAQSESPATAYGTTWLESWWHLADEAKLYADESSIASMVVLGSSLGWQCFLGHLHLGYASCVGYEILKSQVDKSQQLAEDLGLQNAIGFRCQDALTAEIRGAKLVWLNTYAWPAGVKKILCEKMLKELSAGALVVSYEAIPYDDFAGDISSSLELQSVEEMETSWDPQLLAHVYRVVKRAAR